jgi:hypothetical protein
MLTDCRRMRRASNKDYIFTGTMKERAYRTTNGSCTNHCNAMANTLL